jgi:anthranilate synthase/aminodeoxychorismate synthase-like glutamine amidotransferase
VILVVDNYDSFTYNLVQYLGQLHPEVEVVATAEELVARGPEYLLLSPGPGDPDQAGVCLELIPRAAEAGIPLLGVCLGHQAIAQAYGARIVRAPEIVHGKTSPVHHEGGSVFRGLPNPFPATRYHSLCVDPDTLGDDLAVTARTEDGVIMGIRHKEHPIHGVQFHPESVLTECGLEMLRTFLELHRTEPSDG